jgi:hypothetical protein
MGLSTTNLLTLFGFSTIFTFVIVNILEFYGVGANYYGSYIGFYLFMLLSIFVLPEDYPNIISKVTPADVVIPDTGKGRTYSSPINPA